MYFIVKLNITTFYDIKYIILNYVNYIQIKYDNA